MARIPRNWPPLPRKTHLRGHPTGSRLLIHAGSGERRRPLHRCLRRGASRRLTTDPARDILPGWSRDGRWIYFASDRSGTFQTWKMPADGPAPAVQITKGGGFGGTESPDGRFLYYSHTILTGPIWRVPVEGGEEVPIHDEVRSLRLPQNFAVGKHGIVFASSDDPMRRFELRLYSFSTRKTELIARIENGLGNGMSISPDGKALLFTTTGVHSGDLMMVDNLPWAAQ